jgi:hypothetical protein
MTHYTCIPTGIHRVGVHKRSQKMYDVLFCEDMILHTVGSFPQCIYFNNLTLPSLLNSSIHILEMDQRVGTQDRPVN